MINLQTQIFFCCHYQKNDILCDHTIVCIFVLDQFLKIYFLLILSVTVWTVIYVKSMSAVNVNNLHFINDMKCNSSHTYMSCRRLKKKQIWVKNTCALQKLHQKNMKENSEIMRQNAVHYCSTCYKVEHNASTCCRLNN